MVKCKVASYEEIQRLMETGYHIVRIDRRTPYEKYLARAKNLLDLANEGLITTEQYSWEVQILMREYGEALKSHIRECMESETHRKKRQ